MNAIQTIAKEYRAESGRQFGYVVVFDGKPAGWKITLDNPDSWIPGCIAVDEKGREWVALGGNNQNGAKYWEPVAKPANPVGDSRPKKAMEPATLPTATDLVHQLLQVAMEMRANRELQLDVNYSSSLDLVDVQAMPANHDWLKSRKRDWLIYQTIRLNDSDAAERLQAAIQLARKTAAEQQR